MSKTKEVNKGNVSHTQILSNIVKNSQTTAMEAIYIVLYVYLLTCDDQGRIRTSCLKPTKENPSNVLAGGRPRPLRCLSLR